MSHVQGKGVSLWAGGRKDGILIWFRRSRWDFILLTVESWAARTEPGTYLMNKYLTDE